MAKVLAFTGYDSQGGLTNYTWVDIQTVKYAVPDTPHDKLSTVGCNTCSPTALRTVPNHVEMAHYINGQLQWVGDYLPDEWVQIMDINFCNANPLNAQCIADYPQYFTAPPPGCTPNWQCEQPPNGYESDGCGNRRLNSACNPPAGCTPNWQCEQPPNGYESDGCGNRRANPACNPAQAGSVNFASTPPGAAIFIDGVDQSVTTPQVINNVPAGSHTFGLKLAGYDIKMGWVTVTAGGTANVSETLAKTGVAVPGKAPSAGTILIAGLIGVGLLGVIYFMREKTPAAARVYQ